MSQWWDLNICDREAGVGGICDVRCPGVYSSSMSARCCPVWVSNYCLSISDVLVGFCYGFCGEERNQRIRTDAG
jgi:hypothetical protein